MLSIDNVEKRLNKVMHASRTSLEKMASTAKVDAIRGLTVEQDYLQVALPGYEINVRCCPGVVDYVWAREDKSLNEVFEIPRDPYLELRKRFAAHLLKFDGGE